MKLCLSSLLCLSVLVSYGKSLPTEIKLDGSNTAKLDGLHSDEIKQQLLNPEENSVQDQNEEHDGLIQAPVTKDVFPDRRGFVTGHRIPLELFPKETIRNLDLVNF